MAFYRFIQYKYFINPSQNELFYEFHYFFASNYLCICIKELVYWPINNLYLIKDCYPTLYTK